MTTGWGRSHCKAREPILALSAGDNQPGIRISDLRGIRQTWTRAGLPSATSTARKITVGTSTYSANWEELGSDGGLHRTRGIHLLMPVWNWSTNNIPLEYYALGDNLSAQVPNPFYGQSQTFASQPTVELSHLLGLAPQYSQVSPGQATWGRSFLQFS